MATADGEEYEATYIGADKSLDVAVLKIEAKGPEGAQDRKQHGA